MCENLKGVLRQVPHSPPLKHTSDDDSSQASDTIITSQTYQKWSGDVILSSSFLLCL